MRKGTMLSERKIRRLIKLLEKSLLGVEEYEATLSSTCVITDPLIKAMDELEKELAKLLP